MQSINKINSTSIQVKSRSGNVLQLFLFAEKRFEFSLEKTSCGNSNYHPIFCLDSGGALGVSPFLYPHLQGQKTGSSTFCDRNQQKNIKVHRRFVTGISTTVEI